MSTSKFKAGLIYIASSKATRAAQREKEKKEGKTETKRERKEERKDKNKKGNTQLYTPECVREYVRLLKSERVSQTLYQIHFL